MQDSPKHCTRPKVLHTHTNKQTYVCTEFSADREAPLRTQCVGESVKCCTTHCWIVAFGDCPLSSETWCGWAFRGLVDGYPPLGPELPHPLRDITKVGRDEKWAWREKKHILHILNNHIFIIPHSSISLTGFHTKQSLPTFFICVLIHLSGENVPLFSRWGNRAVVFASAGVKWVYAGHNVLCHIWFLRAPLDGNRELCSGNEWESSATTHSYRCMWDNVSKLNLWDNLMITEQGVAKRNESERLRC